MKYLVFLFWIPALMVLYLSIHQEIKMEREKNAHQGPATAVHARHPHA